MKSETIHKKAKFLVYSSNSYDEIDYIRSHLNVVDSIDDNPDICISIGGDGTFIQAATNFDIPILPISSGEEGSTGYYSDVSLKNIKEVVSLLSSGKYDIEELEKRILIRFNDKNYYAVNEALLRNEVNNVYFGVYVKNNNKFEKVYPFIIGGDGLIITSSIGSTAYNLSANGPIIVNSGSLCLTFLNVNGPFKNPIVLNSDKEVLIKVLKYEGLLAYDGQFISKLKPNDEFSVKLSDKPLNVIKFKEFHESLADKLNKIIKSRMVKF